MNVSHQDRARPVVWLAGVLALLLAGAVLPACGSDAPGDGESGEGGSRELSGYTRDPAPSVADVSLPEASGDGRVGFVAGEGSVRIVYFGYTSCPDVCPTTMADVKRARLGLDQADRGRVEFVMVTVDPDRDVPEKLDTYVTTFIPDGVSARTDDPDELRAAADAFGADYSVTTGDDGEIEVSHTAELYAVDDEGTIVLQWPFGTIADDIGRDLETLLGSSA